MGYRGGRSCCRAEPLPEIGTGTLSSGRAPGASCAYRSGSLVERRIVHRGVHGSCIQGLQRFTANGPLCQGPDMGVSGGKSAASGGAARAEGIPRASAPGVAANPKGTPPSRYSSSASGLSGTTGSVSRVHEPADHRRSCRVLGGCGHAGQTVLPTSSEASQPNQESPLPSWKTHAPPSRVRDGGSWHCPCRGRARNLLIQPSDPT